MEHPAIVPLELIGLPVALVLAASLRARLRELRELSSAAAWRWHSDEGGLSFVAVVRPDATQRVHGSVSFRVGDDVRGAPMSSGDVRRAGVRDLARSLDEDPCDLLVAAAFAGMIARGEIRLGPSLTRTWAYDDAMTEVPGWDVRAIAPCASTEPIERAISAAVLMLAAVSTAPPVPYRDRPQEETLVLTTTPLRDAWSAAWSAAKPHVDEDAAPRKGASAAQAEEDDGGYGATRARLADWIEAEPALYDALVALADEHRAERRRKPSRRQG